MMVLFCLGSGMCWDLLAFCSALVFSLVSVVFAKKKCSSADDFHILITIMESFQEVLYIT